MGARILIAEDEVNIAESLGFILGRAGHSVVTVPDGEAALRHLRREQPDLLILDVMLPGLNGFEVLKMIRADARLCGLAVIVLTAKTQKHDREQAEAIGVAAYLTKPFSNREIVETVRQLVAV